MRVPDLPKVTMPPSIREAYFGDAIGFRNTKDIALAGLLAGPPDLCHVGKYVGSHTATFTSHDFGVTDDSRPNDDEGYIGYYHYVNGLDTQNLEAYVCLLVGLSRTSSAAPSHVTGLGGGEHAPRRRKSSTPIPLSTNSSIVDLGHTPGTPPTTPGEWFFPKGEDPPKREVVVTYCAYNVFGRADFRARFVVYPAKKGPVQVDALYQIVGAMRTHLFNSNTVHELPPLFWDELKASQLVRLFQHRDNQQDAVAGLCLYSDFIYSAPALIHLAFTLVRQLPRGSMVGSEVGWGTSTTCGNGGDRKTLFYRNYIVDSLVRLVQLDLLGHVSRFVVSEIAAQYPQDSPFDWVVLQIYKATNGENTEAAFLGLIHKHLLTQPLFTTQLGLVLLEQVHFLLTKGNYRLALQMCQKCILILPLDYDCWHTLMLCYLLNGDLRGALMMLNSLPVVLANKQFTKRKPGEIVVSNTRDLYMQTFLKRMGGDSETISERTFNEYFSPPRGGNDPRALDSSKTKEVASPFGSHAHLGSSGHLPRSRSGSAHSLPKKEASPAPVIPLTVGTGVGTSLATTSTATTIAATTLASSLVHAALSYFAGAFAHKTDTAPPLTASVQRIWLDTFVFSPHLRHPIVGPFYQLPLMNMNVKEVASVDHNLVRLALTQLARANFCQQLLGLPVVSLLDFSRKSTWGRTYDLLCMMVAMGGWDRVLGLKNQVFSLDENRGTIDVVNHNRADSGTDVCESWLELLFAIVYDDLRTITSITAQDNQQHSAAAWLMLGTLGWTVKHNLRELILALVTAVMGASQAGGFDYFGTVQLLEIYNEFVLSEDADTKLDTFHEPGLRFFSNKLILKLINPQMFDEFVNQIEQEYFQIEFVLLHLMKLISWNVRWYLFVPSWLECRILTKLLMKHDAVVIRTRLRVVVEQNKRRRTPSAKKGWFGGSSLKKPREAYEFVDDDTILDYMEALISWIEAISVAP